MRLKLFIFFIIMSSVVTAQDRLLKGFVADRNKTPLRNYYIITYGNTYSSIYTDGAGNFSLKRKDMLIISINISMGNFEMYIDKDVDSVSITVDGANTTYNTFEKSENNGYPGTWQIPLINPDANKAGIAYFNDSLPTYSGIMLPYNVKDIYVDKGKYQFKQERLSEKKTPKGFDLFYNNNNGIILNGETPHLQNEFAQGRSKNNELQWVGPGNNEIYSWGPAIRTLEFDGQPYDYDKNGKLTQAAGSNKAAMPYGNQNFFRTGYLTDNNLRLLLPFFLQGYVETNLNQNHKSSPLRNSNFNAYEMSMAFKRMKAGKFYFNAGASYNISEGKLMSNGSNISSILHALYTTPPTFDNNNGLSAKDASKSNDAWLLSGNRMRSYAPSITDNPYALINDLPDMEKGNTFTANANVRFNEVTTRGFSAEMSVSTLYSKDYSKIGSVSQKTYNRLFERDSKFSENRVNLTARYIIIGNNNRLGKLVPYISHTLNNQTNDIESNFDKSVYAKIDNRRLTNELTYGLKYNKGIRNLSIDVDAIAQNYFSNENDNSSYVSQVLPFLGASVNYNVYSKYFNGFMFYGNVGKSVNEAPLVYKNYSVLSTDFSMTDFRFFNENEGILKSCYLTPQVAIKYNVGASVYLFRNFQFGVNYYDNTINDYIAPIKTNGVYNMSNVAKINNSGLSLNLDYSGRTRSYNHITYNVALGWTTYKNKVLKTYNNEPIKIAGFKEVNSVLKEGESIGAIMGTKTKRNGYGEAIIGANGLPLTEYGVLGSPDPDWVANITPSVSWNNFTLFFALEYSKGGQMWNGTQAWLDNVGMSQSTAELRTEKGMIIKGVMQNGSPNTTPIDYYNPQTGFNYWQSTWQNAENYMQDASHLRLSNVSISYNFNLRSNIIKDLQLTLSGNNLLLFTKYKGGSPASTLFNYSTGRGLDLFNMPSVSSYIISLKMRLHN